MLDWNNYSRIADIFQYKAKKEDREDLRQDIIVRLAEVASNNGHKPFTEGSMIRVASYTVMAYWRDVMRRPATISLNGNNNHDDGNGTTVELWQTLVDDNAIDLEAWQDAKRWLLGCPKRLVQIAYKRYIGKPMNTNDQRYLHRYRQKELIKYQIALQNV
jgi:DNA-directed RNA polymerase specialized sigma24 family protein